MSKFLVPSSGGKENEVCDSWSASLAASDGLLK
jgi:hypothetical protein